MNERLLVRIFVGIALALAIFAFALLPLPAGVEGRSALPAIALQQPALYRFEVALAVFYGGLLVLTPAIAGLVRGRLPVEISARDARFANSADEALEDLEKTTTDLKKSTRLIAEDVQSLKRAVDDKTEHRLGSKP
jgi:hypothetical protein